MESGRWGEGAPGSEGYSSNSGGTPNPLDLLLVADDNIQRGIRLRERMEEAAKNGPVLAAMARWLEGEPVPTFAEQIETFGIKYANHMYAYWQGIRLDHDDRDETIAISSERTEFIRRYGFAVPTSEALDVLQQHQPLLEIGAGSGSWAKLLALRGVDVVATDAMLQDYGHGHGTYFPVQQLAGKTAVRRWPERHVFCAWPSLNETWLRQAARAMRPGRYLCVVTESAAADERTWDYVEEAFQKGADLDLIGWHHCHDRFQEWRKLGPMQRRNRDDADD